MFIWFWNSFSAIRVINLYIYSSNKYFWFWKQTHNCNVRSCLSISSKLPNIVKKQNNRTKILTWNIALKYLNVVSSECLYIGCILSICVSNVYSRENFSLSLKASLSLKPRTKRYPLKALYYTIQRVYDIVKMNMMDQEDIWKY